MDGFVRSSDNIFVDRDNNKSNKDMNMILKLEYRKENGEFTIIEGRFLKWHVNMKGENYITMMCYDERKNYRRIHPERIVSITRSEIEVV